MIGKSIQIPPALRNGRIDIPPDTFDRLDKVRSERVQGWTVLAKLPVQVAAQISEGKKREGTTIERIMKVDFTVQGFTEKRTGHAEIQYADVNGYARSEVERPAAED